MARTLASDGSVMAMLRIDGDAQLARLEPTSSKWTLVAQPIGSPGSFDYREAAGTFVVVADNGSQSFCPPIEWSASPSDEALSIDAFQIVRPESESSTIVKLSDGDRLDTWSVNFTAEGAPEAFAEPSYPAAQRGQAPGA